MKASEGKLGRVFMIRLDIGEKPAETLLRFAEEKGIRSAQVFLMGEQSAAGFIAPNAEDALELRMPGIPDNIWTGGEILLQEVVGTNLHRVIDPDSGRETIARVGSKTKVLRQAALEPEEKGPGTIPIYLFNAEFN